MPAQIHVGDIGTAFRVTVYDENDDVVNISGATTKALLFTKPTNVTVTQDASLVSNGVSGVMQYTSVSGDLDIAGIWKIQGHIIVNSYDLYTDISSFRVYDNLD